MPPVSRRQFLATGSALLAGTCVPAWADMFQPGPADDAMRAEVAEAALARAAALGASYADIRINRYRRESIATRERQVQNVSRSTSYGLGLRVLVNGAWGFAATNRVEPGAARAVAEQAVAIARANAVLASRKVGARQRRQGRDDVDQRLQARSVRGAARNEDRVSDEAERNGPGRVGRLLRQLAGAVRRRTEVLRLERRLANHAAAGADLSAVQHHRRRPRAAETFKPAPSSIGRNWSATNTSRTTRGCAMPKRQATKWSRN